MKLRLKNGKVDKLKFNVVRIGAYRTIKGGYRCVIKSDPQFNEEHP